MSDIDIQDLIKEMHKAKLKDQKEFDKINYKKSLRNKDIIQREKQEMLENMDIKVELPRLPDKEERFRMAWKAPGYKNEEFSKMPTLRGKILDEWEIQRINLAERSYKAPHGFKGFKIPSQYLEFTKPSTPPRFKKHLEEFRNKFDDYVQRPSKYGRVHEDDLIDSVKINNKEPFRLVNSVQYKEFSFDPHLTWEAELTRKNKLKSIKSAK